MVADIVSDVSLPSTGLLLALTGMIEGASTDPGVTGTLTISLGHLASKAAPEGKEKVSEVFTNLLHERQNGCELDPSVMNVLEGIGNLKSDRVAVDVMEVNGRMSPLICREIQINRNSRDGGFCSINWDFVISIFIE
ncbi:hypothetical protein AVEN_240123-1 [Araneus ventricosus]|uniref:Uncharacterized protein n=1 Tax=Araneus ventricosus TaxID=182803 RepID=A0A4Y2SQL0_ARAVE|nr:hypothetical protein AVEN_240123-1 [Araneus ventricosus]